MQTRVRHHHHEVILPGEVYQRVDQLDYQKFYLMSVIIMRSAAMNLEIVVMVHVAVNLEMVEGQVVQAVIYIILFHILYGEILLTQAK
jgi:hypothetical protein